MITLYDISSRLENKAWSPNVFKTRNSLNFKGLEYETIWVEYPDIEPLCKELGGKPTFVKRDGKPHYTLPMIKDSKTGAVVCDSFEIAKYLDKEYPNTPVLMPKGTEALQAMFTNVFDERDAPLWPILLPRIHKNILNTASQDYFISTKPGARAKPEGDAELWKEAKVAFSKFDHWMKDSHGPFVMGDRVTFADFVLLASIATVRRVFGEESTEWKELAQWDGGRWAKLDAELKRYEVVPNPGRDYK